MRDIWAQQSVALNITFQRAPGTDTPPASGDGGVGVIMAVLLVGVILIRLLLGILIPSSSGDSRFDIDGDGGDGGD